VEKVLQEFVQNYKSETERKIESELAKRLQEVKEISPHLVKVIEAMQELSVGGKRLRAMLVILGYELAGKKVNEEVIKAGVAMEIFHLGLLIQDDFMDRDMKRRGVPSMIARYESEHVGNFISMLAGDYTFGWGMEIMSHLKLPDSQIVDAMKVWGKYFTRVGYGQTLDGLDVADDETILKILSIKSGEYSCVLPLLLGATLGGADANLLKMLEEYGMEMGWVFQLRDDFLGYEKDMAKKEKKTYATMYGKDKTIEAIRVHMDKGMELAGDNQLMVELIEWMGTRES
jgi:geranylgeranyl diphosphate synthase type I